MARSPAAATACPAPPVRLLRLAGRGGGHRPVPHLVRRCGRVPAGRLRCRPDRPTAVPAVAATGAVLTAFPAACTPSNSSPTSTPERSGPTASGASTCTATRPRWCWGTPRPGRRSRTRGCRRTCRRRWPTTRRRSTRACPVRSSPGTCSASTRPTTSGWSPLVAGFARPLPFRVIGRLLGVPDDDRPALLACFATLLAPRAGDPPREAVEASDAIVFYLRELVSTK